MSDFEDNRKLWKHEDDFEKDSEGSEKYYSAEENGLEDDSELMKYDKKNTDVVTYLSESENFKLRNTEDKRKQMALILGDTKEQRTKSLMEQKLRQIRDFKQSRKLVRRSLRIQEAVYRRLRRRLPFGSRKRLEIIRKIIRSQTVDWNHLSVSKEVGGVWDEYGNWKGWIDIYKNKKMPTLKAPRKQKKITEEELKKVAMQGSVKIISSKGTTCHQCRNKTLDMKTICRSGKCHGKRGQFCGVCLQKRFGECAKEALMNSNWSCPPCRNICNCIICCNKIGLSSTKVSYPKNRVCFIS